MTKWERQKRKLQQSHERLIAALMASQTRTFRWSFATDRFLWDEGVDELFEPRASPVPSNRDEVLQRVHPEDRNALTTALEQCATEGADLDLAFRVIPSDGSVRWVYAKGKVFPGAANHPAYLMGAYTDITRQKWLEEAVHQQERLLQELREERLLLGSKNKDLRDLATQLTSNEQRERQRIARLLHEHFQQVLVVAQIGLHRLRTARDSKEVSQEASRIGELLEEAVEASRNLATEVYPPVLYDQGFGAALQWLARRFGEEHNLRVEVVADSDAELGVADVRVFLLDSVRELLLNVVHHAKTDAARVVFTKTSTGDVRIIVEDRGKGCDSELLNSRPLGTNSRGLTQLQRRIDLLGGSVGIESAPGQGFRVSLLIPKSVTISPDVSEHAQPAGAGENEGWVTPSDEPSIRVVLADDHAMLRRGLSELLQEEPDINVVGEASDGEEAVTLALELQPDVIIMDVSMPKLDGIEATRRITERLPKARIVGLSMHNDIGVEEAMRKAGASAYLCKGDAPQNLVGAIRRCCEVEV